MIRRLHRGDYQPTLEDAFLREMRERRGADPLGRTTVLVPSNLLKLHLGRLLASSGTPHLNVRFLTLLDAARELGEPALRRSGGTRLTSLGRELLVRAVARGCPDESWFGGVRHLPGFPAVLSATLQDVRDAGLDAAGIAAAAPNRRVRDFAALLEDYERRLRAGALCDDADLFRAAIAAAGRPADAFSSPVLVYGFYDFTSLQRRLVEALAVQRGAVAFVPAPAGPAFAYAAPTLRFWRRLGVAEVPASAPPASTTLLRLRTRLFGAPAAEPLADDGSVRLVGAPGAAAEAREVVRAVCELVEDGVPLHRIGILLRGADGLDEIDAALRTFARDAGLPAGALPIHLHGGRPRADGRAGRALLLLLDVLTGDLARRDVFEWLHYAGGEPRAAAFERLARGAGILGGRGVDEWERGLERVLRRLRFERDRTVVAEARGDDVRRGVDAATFTRRSEELAALRALVRRLGSARAALLAAPDFAARVTVLQDLFQGTLNEAPDDAAGVRDALAELADLDRLGIVCDVETFAALVRRALEAADPAGQRFEHGLFVGTLLPARGVPFEAVIVPRLQDGVFPRRARPDPILQDDERLQLARRLLPDDDVGLPRAARAPDEERLLFRLAAGAARARLVLTWSRLDAATGKDQVPSAALLAAAEALAGRTLAASELRDVGAVRLVSADPAEPGRAPLDLVDFDRALVARAVREGRAAPIAALATLHPPVAQALRAELERWRTRAYTSYDGLLDEDAARRVRDGWLARPLSPSRIEAYAGCPFSWFASGVLGLRAPDDPEEQAELSPLVRGSLVHAVLEEFVKELVATGEPFPLRRERRAALLERLQDVAGRRVDEALDACGVVNPMLRRTERHRLLADLRFFLECETAGDSSRVPWRFEVAFGPGGDLPPLELTVAGRPLVVTGVIDRLDHDGAAAVVLDYKTGRMPSGWQEDDLQGGRRLQLPLYALAVEQADAGGARVTRAEYFYCTRKGGGKRPAADPELWRNGPGPELARVLAGVAGGMADGVFLADPREARRCELCDFKLACGLGAGLEARSARKLRDGRVAGYFALRGAEE